MIKTTKEDKHTLDKMMSKSSDPAFESPSSD